MKHCSCSKHLFISVLLIFNQYVLLAQWSSNTALNTAISLANGDKFSTAITSDDSGGAIITWRDSRNGNYDIYAQRIDLNGVALWKADGIAISTLSTKQQSPVIAPDGQGGAIIVWDNFGQVAAQRVNARGVIQWAVNGVPVTSNGGAKYYPQVVTDDSGGAIIAWEDDRNISRDIYAQRLNGQGKPQWTLNGKGFSMAAGSQGTPKLIADGSGGAIITWQDSRASNGDVYAQKVNRQGKALWQTDGAIVCNANQSQELPEIVTDDSGGAIITWSDGRNGKNDIYAQRINASGSNEWTANGVIICDAYDFQFQPTLTHDSAGGAIIAWGDYRNSFHFDIYAQRIDANGAVQWSNNGIPICTVNNRQFDQKIISDGRGGAIIAWEDYRNSIDIYGQHITSSGQNLWASDGIALSDASGSQFVPTVCDDQNGGMILTWHDNRNTRTDIYAQNVCFKGVPGYTSSRGAINTTPKQNVKICKGNSTKLSVSGSGTVSWYNSDTGGIYLGSGAVFITPKLDSTTVFYAQDSNTCGPGYKRTSIEVMVSIPTDSTFSKVVCNDYLLHNKVLNNSGIYRDTIPNQEGCDSFITLNLTVIKLDTAVKKTNLTLQAQATGATYQWIDCTTKQWMTNDTGRQYTATKSGSYAVIVRKNNCEDTSQCYKVNVGSGIILNSVPQFKLLPNPVDETLILNFENDENGGELLIIDPSGKTVLIQSLSETGRNLISVKHLQNGIYFIQLIQNDVISTQKIVVQH